MNKIASRDIPTQQIRAPHIVVLLGLLFITQLASAVELTDGYFAAGNRFGATIPAIGTATQQTSPIYNPDVFCEMQGAGWHTPQMAEWNLAYKGKIAMSGNSNTMNGENKVSRRVGSLFTEWTGNLKGYNSQWAGTTYWVAEPMNATLRHTAIATVGNGTISSAAPGFITGHVACAISL